VRAAYAALVLGIIGGLGLATSVLSGRPHAVPATVAGALALDVPGVDMDRRRAEAVAVLVAACMIEHGLDWEPWVEPPPSVPDADLGPIEWAERWGFGVSTMADRAGSSTPVDPNLRRSDVASPDIRDAYRSALHGDGAAVGCQAAATTEVYGLRERLLTPMRPALLELDRRIATDPAARHLLASWQTCVGSVAMGLSRDRRTLAARLIEAFGRRLASLDTGTRSIAALAALQADERRVAVVLADCDAAYDAGRVAVASPHEAAFVAANRPALERIGAAIRAAEVALPTLPP
jgi:hypothetical protein